MPTKASSNWGTQKLAQHRLDIHRHPYALGRSSEGGKIPVDPLAHRLLVHLNHKQENQDAEHCQ